MGSGLSRHLTELTAHICLDMQNIFAPGGLWATPWMPKVLPVIAEIAAHHAERTIFTRFITPVDPSDARGKWQDYYAHWADALTPNLQAGALDLIPQLARYVPPATIVDKMHYSGFVGSRLTATISALRADTLVITGAETDVCVLATVLDAVDIGYRVVLVRDGTCSSSDEGHEALMKVFHGRYTHQIETASAEEVLSKWPLRRSLA
jgi:nicotinamidase-related amidase